MDNYMPYKNMLIEYNDKFYEVIQITGETEDKLILAVRYDIFNLKEVAVDKEQFLSLKAAKFDKLKKMLCMKDTPLFTDNYDKARLSQRVVIFDNYKDKCLYLADVLEALKDNFYASKNAKNKDKAPAFRYIEFIRSIIVNHVIDVHEKENAYGYPSNEFFILSLLDSFEDYLKEENKYPFTFNEVNNYLQNLPKKKKYKIPHALNTDYLKYAFIRMYDEEDFSGEIFFCGDENLLASLYEKFCLELAYKGNKKAIKSVINNDFFKNSKITDVVTEDLLLKQIELTEKNLHELGSDEIKDLENYYVMLGLLYKSGDKHTKADIEKAYEYFIKAYNLGSEKATLELCNLKHSTYVNDCSAKDGKKLLLKVKNKEEKNVIDNPENKLHQRFLNGELDIDYPAFLESSLDRRIADGCEAYGICEYGGYTTVKAKFHLIRKSFLALSVLLYMAKFKKEQFDEELFDNLRDRIVIYYLQRANFHKFHPVFFPKQEFKLTPDLVEYLIEYSYRDGSYFVLIKEDNSLVIRQYDSENKRVPLYVTAYDC